ncbi:MAG: PH domain-containing protein [Oscillospiraceae bacterium]|nr:PH domain-containing protein [Oscillospiraceae bacterium]
MIIIKSKTYYSAPKGRVFLSAAAFLITIGAMIALNVLRLYLVDRFGPYINEISGLPITAPAEPVMPFSAKVVSAIMIIVAALYVIFIVILLPMWYKSFKFVVNEKEIISYSGIFSRTFRIMKLSAVQHVSRISLPLSRITCFNFVSVNALGGRLVFMFLSEKDCAEIMKMFRSDGIAGNAAISAHARATKRFAVERTSEGAADYIYKDNSGLDGAADIMGQLSGYSQISFDDSQGDNEQLKFN